MAEDINKLWKLATEHVAKHRFDKAVEAFSKLCKLEPANLTYLRRLGDTQRQAGQTGPAAQTYQKIADSYARDGMLVKAIAVNKLILEIDPKHTATQETLAQLYAWNSQATSFAQRIAKAPSTASTPAPAKAAAPAPAPAAARAPEPMPEPMVEPITEPVAEAVAAPQSKEAAPQQEIVVELEQELPRLPETPIFSDLDPRSFVELLHRCTTRHYEAGDRIINQGDAGESFFVISSGSVKVSRAEPNGEIISLARLREGAFFGEMALLGGGPRTASVVADEESELLEFSAEVLAQLVSEYPSARAAVEKFIRSRLLSNAIAASALFRPFNGEERRRLIERFQVADVAAGQAVLEEGMPGDGLYVVMVGLFQAQNRKEGGEPRCLAEFREGDVFGEISLITGSNTTADVVSVGPGRVLRLPRADFEKLALTHPQIRELAFKLASERTGTDDAVLGGTVTIEIEDALV